jgi:molybdopterin molybdotransferase
VLTVAEACDRILERISILDYEELPLLGAAGRVLAEDVHSEREVPPFANSAMDGFAVRAADVKTASSSSPVMLAVTGEIKAGSAPPGPVEAGTALRIMTGAMLPSGADAVVRVEDTGERDGQVEVRAAVDAGTSVRRAGTDLRRGDLVAEQGRVVTPGMVGVLASAGRTGVRCIRRPRVLVLTTGDELREPGETLGPGQITNTNRYTLRAAVEEAGGEVIDAGVARDERDDLLSRLRSGKDADLLLTSGGVSMGSYDIVRQLMEEASKVDFWQVALRPGKPLLFGEVSGVPLIGLPGNPVSSLVCFELFVRPALMKMQGRHDLLRQRIEAITEEELSNPPHLEQYFRGVARSDGNHVLVRLTGDQGSHVLRSMADANCLIVVPQGTSQVSKGSSVEIVPLSPIE